MQAVTQADRITRAASKMQESGLDYIIVGPSADLRYLTGAKLNTSERLSLLVLGKSGEGVMVTPFFEAPILPALPTSIEIKTWGETENPAQLVADYISTGGGDSPVVGVADHVLSVFLLRIQHLLPNARFTHAAPVLSALRLIKTPEEVDLLRKAGSLADEVFAEIKGMQFSGRTEMQVGEHIANLLKERRTEIAHLPIVGSGPNSASPHHHTGERTIQEGDVLVLDFGGPYEGYFSDITRTVFVGHAPEPGSEEEKGYNLVREAQQAAFEAARPGITAEALDAVARDILSGAGYGEYFSHRLGHGVGLDGHEPPYIVSGNSQVLEPGMAFSIEPGLYLPGRFGVRVEDLVIMGDTAAERLNNAPRDITVVA